MIWVRLNDREDSNLRKKTNFNEKVRPTSYATHIYFYIQYEEKVTSSYILKRCNFNFNYLIANNLL
ncbi:hypothetical protein BpHYR1_009552 [Brachionus plicatilis]|uniref:Uncharacterized protein n=1 Tax=Brachionus plicatilis TaxID=10195 RepID=A0A3M7Q3J0_BRAPC|nr:hypothetical protein BpHYR1_009552 [Brachionus plicatilis]